MSILAPIPVLTYGRSRDTAEEVKERLKPEYDVVHTCLDLHSAKLEIPQVLSGTFSTDPTCNIGSNQQRHVQDRIVPKAIIFGGGIPQSEVDEIRKDIESRGLSAVWIKINPEDINKRAQGDVGRFPELIVEYAKSELGKSSL